MTEAKLDLIKPYDETNLLYNLTAMSAVYDPKRILVDIEAEYELTKHASPVDILYSNVSIMSYDDYTNVTNTLANITNYNNPNDKWNQLITATGLDPDDIKTTMPMNEYMQHETRKLRLLKFYYEKKAFYDANIATFNNAFNTYYNLIMRDKSVITRLGDDNIIKYIRILETILSHGPENYDEQVEQLRQSVPKKFHISDKMGPDVLFPLGWVYPLKKEEKKTWLWWIIGFILIIAVVFFIVFVSVGFIIWFVIGYALYIKRRRGGIFALVKALAYGPFYR
jgi:hypothetical protein